jgi:hypothetical protein
LAHGSSAITWQNFRVKLLSANQKISDTVIDDSGSGTVAINKCEIIIDNMSVAPTNKVFKNPSIFTIRNGNIEMPLSAALNASTDFSLYTGKMTAYDRTPNVQMFGHGALAIELGNNTDTTLSRASAGDVAVEGNRIFRVGGSDVPIADGGTGASTAQAADANLGTWYVIDKGAPGTSHTGDTTETALKTVTIPAGAMGASGQLRISLLFSFTNSTNAKTMRCRFGGASGTQYFAVANSTTGNVMYQWIGRISNKTASSQIGAGNNFGGIGASSSAVVTSAVDTSSAVDLVISGQVANSSETVTLESYTVELCNGA